MKKQNTSPSKQMQDKKLQDKKLKVAEAGILFTFVLGLTIFLGVHFSGQDENTPVTTTPNSASEVIAEAAPVAPEIEIVAEPMTASFEPEVIEKPVETIIPEPRIVTYSLAEQAYFDGEFALASDLFDQYTDEHSSNAWGFYMLGLSQWKAGDPDVAEESFLAALELKPDHQKSLTNYGRVLIELERSDEAREQIEIALAINPENNSARRVLGRIQHNSGQLEAAAETYSVVLRTQQDDAWALNNLGLIRIEQKKFDDAVAPLAKAASLKSNVACIQNNLGVALERSGQFTLASEAFASALDADADYEKAEISLARLENLSQSEEIETMDLAVIAAEFEVQAVVVENTIYEDIIHEDIIIEAEIATPDAAAITLSAAETEAEDMEVAAIGKTSTTENVEPVADGHRNR